MTHSAKIGVEEAVLAGLSLIADERIEDAAKVFGNVLDLVPGHPDLLHHQGVLLHRLGNSELAIELIQKAIQIAPENMEARCSLGNVLSEIDRVAEAEQVYLQVGVQNESYGNACCGLARLYAARGEYDKSLRVLTKAIELNLGNCRLYHCQGNVCMSQNLLEQAIRNFRISIRLASTESDLESSRWSLVTCMVRLARIDEAIGDIREWLADRPDSPFAQHILAAVTGESVPSRASDCFVRKTFDSFATSFDSLLAKLEYAAPAFIASRVQALLGTPMANLTVCDVGCGTGLVAAHIRPFAVELVGVDVSPGMLRKARQRQLYDELVEQELTAFLLDANRRFDLIVCADTLVYFGELDRAFSACRNALKVGGWLCFTLEKNDFAPSDIGYKLEHHGRFVHRESYVAGQLQTCGFSGVQIEEVTLRLEYGESVTGMLVSAQIQD